MELLVYLALALFGTAVVWVGSGLLERSAERLALYYRLPDIVTGAVVVAIGSSFPELSTTVLTTLVHGEFELGVSAIVGSAIFNILVIPGLAGILGGRQLESNRDLVYKESQFYMLSVAVLLIAFAFAAIYHPAGNGTDGAILGRVTRTIALIPLAMYGLYVFVQWQDTIEYEAEHAPESISPAKEWGLLLLSLVLILVAVEALVRAALGLGRLFQIPSFFWGVTVVAAATSIPDAFVSVRAAQKGNAVTALANALGSNVFDLLVCIPIGVLIAGEAVINFTVSVPMMGALTLATLALFLMMRTGMVLSRRESWILLVLYVVFVVWVGAESLGAIDTIPAFPPPPELQGGGH
jgi:cation:H+ antiporter